MRDNDLLKSVWKISRNLVTNERDDLLTFRFCRSIIHDSQILINFDSFIKFNSWTWFWSFMRLSYFKCLIRACQIRISRSDNLVNVLNSVEFSVLSLVKFSLSTYWLLIMSTTIMISSLINILNVLMNRLSNVSIFFLSSLMMLIRLYCS